MKELAALILVALVALAMPVVAQEEAAPGDELVTGTGGIGPDNFLYGLDVAMDNIALFFTFDPAAKAQLGLQIAEERLLEAKTMAEQGKTEAARAAAEQHKAAIDTAKASMEGIPEDGDANMAKEAVRKTVSLQNKIEEHELKASIVIDRVYAKLLEQVPDEAKPEIEEAFTKIKENIASIKERVNAKKENAKLKYKAQTEKRDMEVETEVEEMEEAEGLNAGRAERAEVKIARAEDRINRAIEKVEEFEVPEMDEVKARLENAKDALNATRDIDPAKKPEEINNVTESLKNFGQEISQLAHGLRTGNVTVKQLVNRTRSIHSEVLAWLAEQVPEQALEGIRTGIEEFERKFPEIRENLEGVRSEIRERLERARQRIEPGESEGLNVSEPETGESGESEGLNVSEPETGMPGE